MIIASNESSTTKTDVRSADYSLVADTTPPRGTGSGFRPHELLEAALASCMAITLRLAAQERGIQLEHVSVRIELDRTVASRAMFRSHIEFDEGVSEKHRRLLTEVARLCPVRKTLSKSIDFDESAVGSPTPSPDFVKKADGLKE